MEWRSGSGAVWKGRVEPRGGVSCCCLGLECWEMSDVVVPCSGDSQANP